MAPAKNPEVEAFVDGVRLAWAVHLMLIQESITPRETASGSSDELHKLLSCLEVISSNNVFQSLLDKVLRTAAFQVSWFCVFPFLPQASSEKNAGLFSSGNSSQDF